MGRLETSILAIEPPKAVQDQLDGVKWLAYDAFSGISVPSEMPHITLLHLGKSSIRVQRQAARLAAEYADQVQGLDVLVQGKREFSYMKNGALRRVFCLEVHSDELYRLREELLCRLITERILERKRRNSGAALHITVGYFTQSQFFPMRTRGIVRLERVLDQQELEFSNAGLFLYRGAERIPLPHELPGNNVIQPNFGGGFERGLPAF